MAKHKHKPDEPQPEQPTVNQTETATTEPQGQQATADTPQPEQPQGPSELELLTQKFNDANDKYLRLSAEFDNFRKRTIKEKADLIKTAGGTLLADLLPVVDDFERAQQSMQNTDNIEAVREGIALIYTKFREIMKAKGLLEIEALNQPFDTDLHEALTKIPAPTEELKGKVVDVIQKGYIVDEKVVRFAKVVVGE
jgi:molecular chaperone GrpE